MKVVKNKIAPPFRIAEFDILFGSGIDKYSSLIDAAELCGVIERSGSWYSRGDLKISQGRRAAVQFIKSNEKLALEIEAEVRAAILQKISIESLPIGGSDVHDSAEDTSNDLD